MATRITSLEVSVAKRPRPLAQFAALSAVPGKRRDGLLVEVLYPSLPFLKCLDFPLETGCLFQQIAVFVRIGDAFFRKLGGCFVELSLAGVHCRAPSNGVLCLVNLIYSSPCLSDPLAHVTT